MAVQPLKDDPQELLLSLEEAMVNQFRSLQVMVNIAEEERQALVSLDINQLSKLVQRKEGILDELKNLEETRQKISDKLLAVFNFGENVRTMTDMLPLIKSTASERISRILEGILVMQEKVREMNRVNLSLATSNSDRVYALQEFILSLSPQSSFYQPVGSQGKNVPVASFNMDQKA